MTKSKSEPQVVVSHNGPYLVSGGDGTVFMGASPELLVRRTGATATCQPMAGSVARGRDEADDETLARSLAASAKDAAEHRVTARSVAEALAPLALSVEAGQPEVVRFTNIQHLATTIRARLAEPPDIVVTDLRMPGADGMEVLRTASKHHPQVPVIMITAYGSVGQAVEAIKAGAFDYIEKPFEQDSIRTIVESSLPDQAKTMLTEIYRVGGIAKSEASKIRTEEKPAPTP